MTEMAAAGSGDGARRTGPALEAMYRFTLWLIPTAEKFPRRQKFLLEDRMQATALDVLERLVAAISRLLDLPSTIGCSGKDDERPGLVTAVFPTRRRRARLVSAGRSRSRRMMRVQRVGGAGAVQSGVGNALHRWDGLAGLPRVFHAAGCAGHA